MRAKPAPTFKLAPESSPNAPEVMGRGLTRNDRVWESVRHGKRRRTYYYCKSNRRGFGAYRAVVGTRGYYNKYGLRVLNPDPRPFHEAARTVPAPESRAVKQARPLRFPETLITKESHWDRPQGITHLRIPSGSTSQRTGSMEQGVRHEAQCVAAGHPGARVLFPLRTAGPRTRADAVPAHVAGPAVGRAESQSDSPQRQERAACSLKPRSQPASPKDSAQQRHSRGAGARNADGIRNDVPLVRATDMESAPAARGPDLLSLPMLDVLSAPVSVHAPQSGQAVGLVESQSGAQAARADTPAGAFAETCDAPQSAPITAAPGCQRPEMQCLKAAPARRASNVYIPPSIRRKALVKRVVGAEALPE